MIQVSAVEVSHNFDILFSIMSFWSTSLNAFIFPWEILTPTVLDVTAILGIPAGGRDVHVDLDFSGVDPKYTFTSSFTNLMAWNAKKTWDVT